MTDRSGTSKYLEILLDHSEPILYEEKDWFVLFAKRPCNEGHLLIVPKLKEENFYELPEDILNRGLKISVELCKVLENMYKPVKVALFIKGFTNDDHSHIHVTPAYKSEDLDKDLSRP